MNMRLQDNPDSRWINWDYREFILYSVFYGDGEHMVPHLFGVTGSQDTRKQQKSNCLIFNIFCVM